MADWMRSLNDKLSVAELSIPGIHDSAAYKKGADSVVMPGTQGWWKCQQMTIREQLYAGIRYFDLRIRYYPTDERRKNELWHFHHADVYLGSPDAAIHQIAGFLGQHPKEFVILQIQQEHSDLDYWKFGKMIKEYLWDYKVPIFNYNGSIPTVGQLRGKAWLIQAAKVKMNEFQIDTCEPIRLKIEKSNYVLQNAWKDPTSWLSNDDEVKQKAIRDLLSESKWPNRMKINFISWEPGERGCHNKYFEKIIHNYSHLGVCIMDYPPQHLINKIINKN